ncbi:MAG: carboxymuconolactone decarboxylase family protein [Candidatus Diapherotrites archaeon]|nr:carboxymuconolactone decarboxylase family protein [Candidatus Diapherotrites archaeon]
MAKLFDAEHMKAVDEFKKAVPDMHKAYDEWKKKAMSEGALDRKTKELIGVGIAVAINCEYCMDSHTKKAKAFGATKQEIAEAIQVAAGILSGSALSQGMKAMQSYDEK